MKRSLSLMALFYYALFAGGAFGVYSALYFHEVGLSNSEIGLIGGLPPVIAIATQPVWGMVADRWGARTTLTCCLVGAAIIYFFFPFAHSFIALFVLSIIVVLITNPINPIADSTALSLLQDRRNYGNLRLFGSLGYAMAAFVGGQLLHPHHYGVLYDVLACSYALCVLLSVRLPATLDRKSKVTIRGAIEVATRGRMPMFLLCSALMIMAVSGNWLFFSLWLTAHGGTTSMVGIAFFIEAILEVPVFLLISRYRSHLSDAMLMTIGCVAYIVRFTLLYADVPLVVVFLTQFLPGLGFTAIYAAQVNYVDKHTPQGLKATGQTILSVAGMGGIGSLLGGIVMGSIAQHWSISVAYASSAAILVLICPCIVLFREQRIAKVVDTSVSA